MSIWNETQCMSKLNDKSKRCRNKIYKNSDFCRKHNEFREYDNDLLENKLKCIKNNSSTDEYLNLIINKFDELLEQRIKYLDKNYIHSLIGLYDSWREVPIYYWFKADNVWWDIRTLIQIISVQLNQTELEKPYPIFPENPFTRNKFTVNDLCDMKNFISDFHKNIPDCKLNVNIALNKFLTLTRKNLSHLRKETVQYNISTQIVQFFSSSMRFKMINYKDSQGRYCGYWVKKGTPKSIFEKYYNEIITATIVNQNMLILLNTPSYRKIIDIISKLEPEEYNI